ncbi:Protein of unknown function [Leuconostoc citreum LBAE C11]|nr:Protein of unknown function [Leuconostoc citreum LBAE C11]
MKTNTKPEKTDAPNYILNILLSMIIVRLQTLKLIDELTEFEFQ